VKSFSDSVFACGDSFTSQKILEIQCTFFHHAQPSRRASTCPPAIAFVPSLAENHAERSSHKEDRGFRPQPLVRRLRIRGTITATKTVNVLGRSFTMHKFRNDHLTVAPILMTSGAIAPLFAPSSRDYSPIRDLIKVDHRRGPSRDPGVIVDFGIRNAWDHGIPKEIPKNAWRKFRNP
jgi:hypothetical protein